MSWYDTDDFDYMYYRLIWGDIYPGLREDPGIDPVPESWREWGGHRRGGGGGRGTPTNTREIRRLRRDARRKAARAEAACQRMFDDVCTAARGMPPQEIAPALAYAFAQVGQRPDDAQLADYAERVSRGGRIILRIEWPREWRELLERG